jgi:hypothetical protein
LDDISQISMGQKRRARQQVKTAITAGRLVRQPCMSCGAVKVQAHHHDYTKPLEVEWLCTTCHGKKHQILPLNKLCEVCGKTFTPRPTKRRRAKTCSWECRNLLLSKIGREQRSTSEWREAARQRAFENGSAERAKTLVLARWAKRTQND